MARDVSKGDIPALVLAVIAEGPCHGYAIAREVERRSGEVFRLREGSLYPALRALERDGLIEGEWEAAGGPARKVYVVTKAGQQELARRARDWAAYAAAINAFIGGTNAQTA